MLCLVGPGIGVVLFMQNDPGSIAMLEYIIFFINQVKLQLYASGWILASDFTDLINLTSKLWWTRHVPGGFTWT